MRDDGIRIGGPRDPVAQNIRNEQNRDAMPSPAEIEQLKRTEETVHAEYTAAVAFLDHFDVAARKFPVRAAAQLLHFQTLERELRGSVSNWKAFRAHREEPHERPESDDVHPQYYPPPPMKVTDRVRELKGETFMRVQQMIDHVDDVRTASRILMPFGASHATVVVIEYTSDTHRDALQERVVYTNATWEKAMDDDAWSDRFTPEEIDEYQQDLADHLAIAMEGRYDE